MENNKVAELGEYSESRHQNSIILQQAEGTMFWELFWGLYYSGFYSTRLKGVLWTSK